jgi:hypothetical protein
MQDPIMQDPAFDPLKMLFDLQLLAHELAQANLRLAAQLNQQQDHCARLYGMCDTVNRRVDVISQQAAVTHDLVKQLQKTHI